jgi:hypothetical protein
MLKLHQQAAENLYGLYQNEQQLAGNLDNLRRTFFLVVKYLTDNSDFSMEKLGEYSDQLADLEEELGPELALAEFIGVELEPIAEEPPAEEGSPPEHPEHPEGAAFFGG